MTIKAGTTATLRWELKGWPEGTEVEVYFVPAYIRRPPTHVAIYFPDRTTSSCAVEALAIPLQPDVVSV